MKIIRLPIIILASCFLSIAVVTEIEAQPIPALTSFNITGSNPFTSLDYTMGWEFQVNNDISVTALGFFDVGGNGLLTNHRVGIWTSSGTLLGSVTVTPTSSSSGGYFYEDLSTPINLTAGNSYLIGTYVYGDAFIYNADNIITDPSITIGDSYEGDPGFIFPTNNNGRVDLTPNFKFTSSNQPPVAVCQDVTVSADENCEASVSANQVDNGSYDPDGDDITFSLSPAGPYPKGETDVTLTVSDGQASTTCSAKITVVDNTKPVLSAVSEPIELWPPDHGYATSYLCPYRITVQLSLKVMFT